MIVNIMGNSGSGKDTLAKMLTLIDDRYHLMKFASNIKREVEQRFGLPQGLLEHRAVKAGKCELSTKTYSALLVDLYHATADILPEYKLGMLESDISMCLAYGLIPVFTDCRNECEAKMLSQYTCYHIWRVGGEAKSSDSIQQKLFAELVNDNHYLLVPKMDSLTSLFDLTETIHQTIMTYYDSK